MRGVAGGLKVWWDGWREAKEGDMNHDWLGIDYELMMGRLW